MDSSLPKRLLRSLLAHSPSAFAYSLFVYLLLILLENIFPGFVSNSINLNYFLIPVGILGTLASFAPEQPTHTGENPKRFDYVVGIFLALAGGGIIYYKTSELGTTGIVLAAISGVLIGLIHWLTLQAEPIQDEAMDEDQMPKMTSLNIGKLFLYPFRHFLWRRLSVPVPFFFVITIVIAIVWNKNALTMPLQTANTQVIPTIAPPSTIVDKRPNVSIPEIDQLTNTPVTLLWGGATQDETLDIAKLLMRRGLSIKSIGDAGRIDYVDATVYFRAEEASVAAYLVDGLQNVYPNVIRQPTFDDTKPDITVILGKKTVVEPTINTQQ